MNKTYDELADKTLVEDRFMKITSSEGVTKDNYWINFIESNPALWDQFVSLNTHETESFTEYMNIPDIIEEVKKQNFKDMNILNVNEFLDVKEIRRILFIAQTSVELLRAFSEFNMEVARIEIDEGDEWL